MEEKHHMEGALLRVQTFYSAAQYKLSKFHLRSNLVGMSAVPSWSRKQSSLLSLELKWF